MSKKTTVPKQKTRKWSAAEEEELVDILNEEAANGNRSDNGWKKTVWQICVDRFATLFPQAPDERKETGHMYSRWDRLKKQWCIVRDMRQLSGFGWIEETQMVYAKDEVWTEYLKAHPDARPFRIKPFPLYDKLTPLCEPIVARGDRVVRIPKGRQQAAQTLDEFDNENDGEVADEEGEDADEIVEVAQPDDEDDNEDEEDALGTPAPRKHAGKKRAASQTPAPRKRTRMSGAHGLMAVADAVRGLSEAMQAGPPPAGQEGSPVRHTNAIHMLEKEPGISDEDRLTAIDLFVDNPRLGDSYLGFSDPNLRSQWLQRQLRKQDARMSEQAQQAALFTSAWSSSPVPANFDTSAQSSFTTASTSDSLPT
ncbi:hypothetical protein CALVIDRAFT_566456 [Calocera viscosa TUFC12733]|uniref:Myb/SANT-like domain-containing protein n=1 Tax=Calocera viscosa (strain TUFC12733) TaxID=1330018 RepID=A0A167JCC6_CALVF|nr:hypothetical protein CALVIDRAFT_566456 [Calocera viscosa TUFC12733]